jgi:glycosyltransferase involved in cell wall biosynthesis
LADHAAFAASAIATAGLTGPADVVVAETPPLFCAAAGVVYARCKRAAYVVNVADLWPASAVELGALRDRRAIAAASALERWIYRSAPMIVAPTRGIVARLDASSETAGKAHRLWPVVDVARFDPAPPEARGAAPLRLLFAGTIGLAHGLETLVEASRLAGAEVVQTMIAGGGAEAERIEAMIRQGGVRNVTMLGVVPAERIPGLYAAADAGAVLLRDLPLFRAALPTKLLEVMSAGRPVLLAARGEAAEVVSEAGAGLVVEPGDPAALAAACERLQADRGAVLALGRAGRSYADAHFGVERAVDAWCERLDEAITSHSVSSSRG